MNYTDVYKVNYIKDNKIDSIYVFNDRKLEKTKLFTKEELNFIHTNEINIIFSLQEIHMDDTIAVIKSKILNELNTNLKMNYIFEEIYLYCQKKQQFDSLYIYQLLTQDNTFPLTKLRLDNFLSNIVVPDDTENTSKQIKPPQKDIYSLDDIIKLQLNNNYIFNKIVGDRLDINEDGYMFIVDPYRNNNKQPNKNLEKLEINAQKIIYSLDNQLLLNTGDILNNNLFLCIAENVIKNNASNPEYYPYYPFLNSKQLNDIKEGVRFNIKSQFNSLLNENNERTINMFYDIFYNKQTELKYVSKGIKYIKAVINSKNINKLPIDLIFKILHATQQNPLIKLNPLSKQENIFRLYANNTSIDGRKIPYLKKALIFDLIKTIGKTPSVSVYIENLQETELSLLVCEINEDGYITIISEFKQSQDEDIINKIFKQYINPIIEEINTFFQQSGYVIESFYDLRNSNIEILQLTYESKINITKNVDIELYKTCLSSFFVGVSDSLTYFRFKRVSNYSNEISQEAFIIESLNDPKNDFNDIKRLLLNNYPNDITEENAESLITKIINENQDRRRAYKANIKIIENPGFKTFIDIDRQKEIITIRVENINDINYLHTIPIYLDTMVRITQDKKKFPIKQLNDICSGKNKQTKQTKFVGGDISDSDDLESIKSYKSNDDLDELESIKSYKSNDDLDELESIKSYKSNKSVESVDSVSDELESIKSYKSNKSVEPVESVSDEVESISSYENEDTLLNIDNMLLKKKNPFWQKRIEKFDPALIIKEDTKEFNSYSRVCPSNTRRQPVILTDKELLNIQKEHPNFLKKEDIIKYGSNPNKQFNYICPKYWCLKNNTIVDPSDLKEVIVNGKTKLKSSNCGYVLDRNSKKVEPGSYVYEFAKITDNKRYPGLTYGKHPNGLCLPCCFDKYNTVGRVKTNLKCYNAEKSKNVENVENAEDEYIKGPEKIPLDPGRWGYLQPQVHTLLGDINTDCQKDKLNEGNICLLRHGIEINDKQSFIACISDVLFYGKKTVDNKNATEKVLPITEMKELIIKSVNIDDFITYQNGNLVTNFYNIQSNIDNNNITKYNNSKLYATINKNNEQELFYYKKVVNSFENFQKYLRDNDVVIDHIYLWDIISRPNNGLFPNGVNLVILNIPNNDITNNIELLCPTNHYSSEFYSANKPTIILVKNENYYEPIYSYAKNKKNITIKKEFNERNTKLPSNIRTLFTEVIKPFLSLYCKPLDSMPNIYKVKQPILLNDLLSILKTYDYKILKVVLNFNNKIIGVLTENPNKKSAFVPCYPSNVLKNDNIDVVFMNDISLWRTYEETIEFLKQLKHRSKKRRSESNIPCEPLLKVIEDELIVGILTETNQFIQISNPISELDITIGKDIPSIRNNDYVIQKNNAFMNSDSIITSTNEIDVERNDYVKKIKLETYIYNNFRNNIRTLLNEYQNIKIRNKLEEEISKEYIIYTEKLKIIHKILRELVQNRIQFIGDKKYYKLFVDLLTCINKDSDTSNKSSQLCLYTNENNKCNIILPKYNLITNKLNELIYFERVSDELIRYSNIRKFMFQPKTFFLLNDVGYNLRDNEIILFQSLITQDYFNSLHPTILNKYVKYNTYDQTTPIKTQFYDNTVDTLILTPDINKDIICFKKTHSIKSKIWKECFPSNYNEIEYDKNIFCTFNIISDLIEKKTRKQLTMNELKNILFNEYRKYLPDYEDKIINILSIEGKKTLGDKVNSGSLTFDSFIYNDNYYLTPFDFWILVNKYEIPTMFISTKYLLQTNYERTIFVAYGNKKDDFAFIIIPGLRYQAMPSYKIVENETHDVFISNNKLCIKYINGAFESKISIQQFLEKYEKPKLTKYKYKKPNISKLLINEDDTDDEKEETFVITPIVKNTKLNKTKKIIQAKTNNSKKNKQE